MGDRFAAGKRALGICDRCGFQYYLKELKEEMRKDNPTGLRTCPECWDGDHPQLQLGNQIVDDPQTLRNPRPDSAELAASRALIQPAASVIAWARAGDVTIVVS